MALRLQDIPPGRLARVLGFGATATGYRQRLLAMGLTPGTTLKLIRVAPLGDPVLVELRGFRLSLRKDEAAALQIELVTP